MFTGIVERTATVSAVEDRPGSRRLTLRIPERAELPPWRSPALGDSVSVSGVCLTVVASAPASSRDASEVSFEIVPETLRATTLGELADGDDVNLERSLALGDVLGGHFVTGHVDGVGTVRSRSPQGDQVLFEIAIAEKLLDQVIEKGSVGVDGISLTVVDVDRRGGAFRFAAIPHTLERTTLAARPPGARVNIETDAFGKWVLHGFERLLGEAPSPEALRRLIERRAGDGGAGPEPS